MPLLSSGIRIKVSAYGDNRLLSTHINSTGKAYCKGKRVAANCPMTAEERAAYVHKGAIAAVFMIKTRLQCGLTEAKTLLDNVRFAGMHSTNTED